MDIGGKLFALTNKINNYSYNQINESKNKIISLKEQVLLQDPQKILSRGFVLVKSTQDKPITRIKLLNINQQINLIFNDGVVKATIEEIKK